MIGPPVPVGWFLHKLLCRMKMHAWLISNSVPLKICAFCGKAEG